MPTNIAITGEIYGKTTAGAVPEAGVTVASNPAGSGKILRVGSLLIANTTGSVNAEVIAVVRRGGTEGASSIYFNGASHLTLANNSGLSFSGDFTVEAFIYLISNANYGGILDCRDGTGQRSYMFGVRNDSYQRLVWVDAVNGERNSDSPIYFNRWTHVAVVKSGSSIYFYIDGVRDATVTTSASAVNASAANPLVGKMIDGYFFNGYLEELRVSDTARYSGASFSVPTSPFADNHVNSKLLLHGDGSHDGTTFTDSVLSPHSISATGPVRTVTSHSVFIGDEKRLAHRITVPANASLAVLDKPLYLEEGDRIVCLASTNGRLEYTCSYEEIG